MVTEHLNMETVYPKRRYYIFILYVDVFKKNDSL